ncbi:MAG: 3'-5' exonuclease, partial [Verrucomicrobiota bacterium]
DLAIAARTFDTSGSKDIDEFVQYARSYTVRDPDTRSAVQVMTVHKSKGLTFDMAILPDLEGQTLNTIRRQTGVKTDESRATEWVFDVPPKYIAENDPVLADFLEDRTAESAYESLCKFYVAMTRAKYANYLISSPKGSNGNFIQILTEALSEEAIETEIGDRKAVISYQTNLPTSDPEWYTAYSQQEPEETAEMTIDHAAIPRRLRVSRRTPSGSEKGIVTAKHLFSREGKVARELGTLIHEWFELIEWIEDFKLTSLPVQSGDAFDQFAQCLENDAVRTALSRPNAKAECWREKRFEILLQNEWLSGTFDRVVIDHQNKKATILDFKTDRVKSEKDIAEAVEKYRPQLETYRQVLERMTDIAGGNITLQLLFTRPSRVVEL